MTVWRAKILLLLATSPLNLPGCGVFSASTGFEGLHLKIESGENQNAPVLSTLEPVVLRLQNEAGDPIEGVELSFALLQGEGSVEPTTALTDAAGLAHAIITLGSQVGAGELLINAAEIEPQSVAFATLPGEVASIAAVATNETTLPLDTPIEADLSVRLQDAYGNPVANALVSYHPSDSGIVLDGSQLHTNQQGIANNHIGTLLTALGSYSVEARYSQLNTILSTTFQLTITSGSPTSLAFVSDQGLVDYLCNGGGMMFAGEMTTMPISIVVHDFQDNPVVAAKIHFTSATGKTLFDPAVTLTDLLGRAGTFLTAAEVSVPTSETITAAVVGTELTLSCNFTIMPKS